MEHLQYKWVSQKEGPALQIPFAYMYRIYFSKLKVVLLSASRGNWNAQRLGMKWVRVVVTWFYTSLNKFSKAKKVIRPNVYETAEELLLQCNNRILLFFIVNGVWNIVLPLLLLILLVETRIESFMNEELLGIYSWCWPTWTSTSWSA